MIKSRNLLIKSRSIKGFSRAQKLCLWQPTPTKDGGGGGGGGGGRGLLNLLKCDFPI